MLSNTLGLPLSTFPTAVSPGSSQDKAACPLCHTQEGDLHGSTCVQSFCSCSIAPGDPEASGRCSPVCSQCQRPLAGKSCGAQSPQLLPQCPRHMKQVQLLFCEDHKEPICLICRLSQEHQGHQVRPIEEAALEYKVRCPLPGPLFPTKLDTWALFFIQPLWDGGALVRIPGL